MKSIVRTRVKNGWWLSCGHKANDVDRKLAQGDVVECVKCDTKLSKHSSARRIESFDGPATGESVVTYTEAMQQARKK